MKDKTLTPATLRSIVLEDKEQLAVWQQQFNAYFDHEEPIDYLDEAREIAHYLMELVYAQKELDQATANLEAVEDRSQLISEIQSFHEEVLDFKSFFDTFLDTSKASMAIAV